MGRRLKEHRSRKSLRIHDTFIVAAMPTIRRAQ
jgi:hypothetical protein